MIDAFIIAVSASEEKLNKIFNIATIYVFRTFGDRCNAFAMILTSPGKITKEPATVCIYAGFRGELTYVTSIPYEYVKKYSNEKLKSRKMLIVDMYKPPCILEVEYVCSGIDIIGRENMSKIEDKELRNILKNIEVYREINEESYAYIILNYKGIDTNIITYCTTELILLREFIMNRLSIENLLEILNSLKEKIKIVD